MARRAQSAIAVAAVVLGLAAIHGYSGRAAVAAPQTTSALSIERGRHLALVMGCTTCHGATFGGTKVFDQPSSVVLWASNLTRGSGGFLAAHGMADFDRAVRHGYGPDGKKLLEMPSWDFAGLSNDDLANVYAVVRAAPPVNRTVPKVRFGPQAAQMIAAGVIRYDADRLAHTRLPALDSTPGVNAAYGRYLTRILGCQACHGELFTGSPPGVPVGAPPLTPRTIGTWTARDFVNTIRTGKTPTGMSLGNEMPWRIYAKMTDDELHAIHAYLKTFHD